MPTPPTKKETFVRKFKRLIPAVLLPALLGALLVAGSASYRF